MSKQNDNTVRAYNAVAQAFIVCDSNRVRDGFYNQWLDESLARLTKDASILEIGSARGRDATYLATKGYAVQVSDATTAFLEHLKTQGFEPLELNIITEAPTSRYDALLASAVFLHFTEEDLSKALANVATGLKDGGLCIFSVIEGEGEKLSHSYVVPRYFRYWTKESLETILANNGFVIIDFRKTEFETQTWLYVVAQKRGRHD